MSPDVEAFRRFRGLLRRELRSVAPVVLIAPLWIGLALATAGAAGPRAALLGGVPLLVATLLVGLGVRLGRELLHAPSRDRLFARPVERREVLGAKLVAAATALLLSAGLFAGALALAPSDEREFPDRSPASNAPSLHPEVPR